MFKAKIVMDSEKMKQQNLNKDKVMNYIDTLHECKEIRKVGEGEYEGITCSTELAMFGRAMGTLKKTKWFRDTVKSYVFTSPNLGDEDVLKTLEQREEQNGRKYYEVRKA